MSTEFSLRVNELSKPDHRLRLPVLNPAVLLAGTFVFTVHSTDALAYSTSTTLYTSTGYSGDASRNDNKTNPHASSARSDSAAPSGGAASSATATAEIGHLTATAATSVAVQSVYHNSQGDLYGRLDGGSAASEANAGWWDNIQVTASGYTGGGYLLAELVLTGFNSSSADSGFVYEHGANGASLYLSNKTTSEVMLVGSGLTLFSSYDSACPGGGRLSCSNLDNSGTGSNVHSYDHGSVHNLEIKIPLASLGNAAMGYEIRADNTSSATDDYYRMSGATGASSSASIDLAWGGVIGVYNSQGVALSNYNIKSDSGFNYAQAAIVPLPAASGFFISGLIGLIGLVSGKSRTHTRI